MDLPQDQNMDLPQDQHMDLPQDWNKVFIQVWNIAVIMDLPQNHIMDLLQVWKMAGLEHRFILNVNCSNTLIMAQLPTDQMWWCGSNAY